MCCIGSLRGLGWPLSQFWRTRQKVILLSLVISALAIALTFPGFHLHVLRSLRVLGLAAGYGAVFMTVASEQFERTCGRCDDDGPNFVLPVALTLSFQALKGAWHRKRAAAIGWWSRHSFVRRYVSRRDLRWT